MAVLVCHFLVVLKPALGGRDNATIVSPVGEAGGTLGCRLVGGGRTVTLRFPADRDGVGVTAGGRRIDLTVTRPGLNPQSWRFARSASCF